MSNNCKYCGNPVDGEAEVCADCMAKNSEVSEQQAVSAPEGEQQSGQAAPEKNPYIQINTEEIKKGVASAAGKVADKAKEAADAAKSAIDNKKISKKNIIIAAAAVAAAVILIILIAAFSTPAYEKPIEYFITGVEKDSYKTVKKAFPKFLIKELEDSYYDIEDLIEEAHEEAEDEYGRKFKMSYKIKKKSKLDKDDLEDLEDVIDDYYDEEVKVSAGYKLKVEIKVSGGGESDKEKAEICVYKIDGQWVLMGAPLN